VELQLTLSFSVYHVHDFVKLRSLSGTAHLSLVPVLYRIHVLRQQDIVLTSTIQTPSVRVPKRT